MFTISTTTIVFGLLVVLFLVTFFMGRRFGLLGLGLAAGVLLSSQLSGWLEQWLLPLQANYAEYLGTLTTAQIASMLVLLAPSLVLLTTGPRYHGRKMKFVGALLYTTMAAFALLPFVLSSIDIPTDVKNIITSFNTTAIVAGVVVAVIDLVMPHHAPVAD
jgi:hypothetical protein